MIEFTLEYDMNPWPCKKRSHNHGGSRDIWESDGSRRILPDHFKLTCLKCGETFCSQKRGIDHLIVSNTSTDDAMERAIALAETGQVKHILLDVAGIRMIACLKE